jgi:hypothetical protein
VISTDYEETVGPALQMQKSVSHDHEENVYEIIPDYVQSPGGVIPRPGIIGQGHLQVHTSRTSVNTACHVIPTIGSQSSGSPQSHGRNSMVNLAVHSYVSELP